MLVNHLADKELSQYLAPLLQPVESGQEELSSLKLRMMVETMSLAPLRQLNRILLGGHFEHLNRSQWLKVVQDSFNQTPIAIASLAHLQVVYKMIAPTPYKLQVTLGNGQTMTDQEVVLVRLASVRFRSKAS